MLIYSRLIGSCQVHSATYTRYFIILGAGAKKQMEVEYYPALNFLFFILFQFEKEKGVPFFLNRPNVKNVKVHNM